MYSRHLASRFRLIAAAFLFVLLLQMVSAAPAPEPVPVPVPVPAPEPVPVPEPQSLTPGEVTSKNRNLACAAGSCYYTSNGTAAKNTTDTSAVPVNSTDATSESPAASGALSLHEFPMVLSMVVAGTSLLFML